MSGIIDVAEKQNRSSISKPRICRETRLPAVMEHRCSGKKKGSAIDRSFFSVTEVGACEIIF